MTPFGIYHCKVIDTFLERIEDCVIRAYALYCLQSKYHLVCLFNLAAYSWFKRRPRHMEALDLYHWSGIIGIVAGALNVIVELLPERIGQPLDLLVNTLGL